MEEDFFDLIEQFLDDSIKLDLGDIEFGKVEHSFSTTFETSEPKMKKNRVVYAEENKKKKNDKTKELF